MIASMEDFGNELKKKRVEKNISIRDIYEKTRIDAKYLEEMEKGNFDFMPDVYMRAFIRKYADSVDFSPEEAIKMYDAARKGKNVEETVTEESNSTFDDAKKKSVSPKTTSENNYNSDSKNNPIILIVLAVAIVIAIASYFIFSSGSKEEIIIEPNIEEQIDNNETSATSGNVRFETKKAATADKTEITKQDSLLLKINAVDTSWFRIKIDGKTDDEFILYPQRTKMIYAQSEINLLLGNSGGVEFFLNGKKLKFSGKKGEIRNISIDADGIHLTHLNSNINLK